MCYTCPGPIFRCEFNCDVNLMNRLTKFGNFGNWYICSVATAWRGSASARLHRLITQNGAARSAKPVTGSAAMAKSGLAAARSRLLYQ